MPKSVAPATNFLSQVPTPETVPPPSEVHQRLSRAKNNGRDRRVLDWLLAKCLDEHCPECARIICPRQDSLHFQSGGCPSCRASNST